MKKITSLLLFVCCLQASIYSQYVGIGTETPTAMLDINGDVVFRTADLTVADSATLALDVNTEKFSCYRISGADSAFTLAGITAGMDGRVVTLINESDFPMQLNYEDTTAAPADRIVTGNHEDMVLEAMGMVTLQYDTSAQKWLVNSSNQVPAGATVWDTTGADIFFENFVGIGTDEPTAPLSIETEVDEIGFSHMAGDDSITVASSVSEIAGSVGTTTDHVFSLNAGGAGKMHIWPDGDVVIGEDSTVQNMIGLNQTRMNPYDSKLSVFTPLNETGFTHIGGDNQIIVDEAIGGVSASLGTMTNNTFRLKTNNLGRIHILPDGRATVSPNDYAAQGQFTVYQQTEGQNGITAVTPNNSNGFVQYGESGQVLVMRVGGPFGSAGVGTHSDTHLRLQCNSQNAINVISPSLNVGIGIDFPPEKLTVRTPAGGFGISHRADGGEILATHIAGGATSIGTWSNHPFRLICNSQNVINMTTDAKVGIGTLTPQQKLDVNGTIRSKEIIVELINWPDYVFNENYQLTSLHELEEFIEEHHHLPNIPSAKEVESEGQHVGALQQKMMEKIEELTLHIIELNKRIETLEQRNQ